MNLFQNMCMRVCVYKHYVYASMIAMHVYSKRFRFMDLANQQRFRFMHTYTTCSVFASCRYNIQRFRFMHIYTTCSVFASCMLTSMQRFRSCMLRLTDYVHTQHSQIHACMHRSIHFHSTHMLNNPVTESFKAVHGGSSEGSTGFNRNCNRRLDLPRTFLLNTVCMYMYIYIYIYICMYMRL